MAALAKSAEVMHVHTLPFLLHDGPAKPAVSLLSQCLPPAGVPAADLTPCVTLEYAASKISEYISTLQGGRSLAQCVTACQEDLVSSLTCRPGLQTSTSDCT